MGVRFGVPIRAHERQMPLMPEERVNIPWSEEAQEDVGLMASLEIACVLNNMMLLIKNLFQN